jgi:hypothetical protein
MEVSRKTMAVPDISEIDRKCVKETYRCFYDWAQFTTETYFFMYIFQFPSGISQPKFPP